MGFVLKNKKKEFAHFCVHGAHKNVQILKWGQSYNLLSR